MGAILNQQISSILLIVLGSSYLVLPVYGSAQADELKAKAKAPLGKTFSSTPATEAKPQTAKSTPVQENASARDKALPRPVKDEANKSTKPDEPKTKTTKVESAKLETKTESTKERTAEKKSKSSEKSVSQKSDSRQKKSSITHKQQSLLVPPPPPSVPTLNDLGMPGMGNTMVFMGENVDYMPASELRDLKDKTVSEIERSRRSVEELSSSASEKQQRADSFDQLYAEGVVSRKELETSKHESEKTTQDLKEGKQMLSLLEQKLARIEKRLAELLKTKKSSKASGTRHK